MQGEVIEDQRIWDKYPKLLLSRCSECCQTDAVLKEVVQADRTQATVLQH